MLEKGIRLNERQSGLSRRLISLWLRSQPLAENAAVSKTVILGNRYREFESLSLRRKRKSFRTLCFKGFFILNGEIEKKMF